MSELTHRKASGTWYSMGKWGELKSGDTLSCCHCQFTRILQKGSGVQWFWCMNCAGYHCGGPNCRGCQHWEQKLENIEAGRPLLTPAPVKILIPAGVDGLK